MKAIQPKFNADPQWYDVIIGDEELGEREGQILCSFQLMKASSSSGKYSDIMINDCKKIGMKPVCDHPSYCKTDKNAVYIGQTHHLAHGGHRGTSACVAG